MCASEPSGKEAWNPANFGWRGLPFLGQAHRRPSLKLRWIRAPKRQLPRRVAQRIFVAVSAIEQQHPLVFADQPALERQPPSGHHRAALRAQQETVVARDIVDRLSDRRPRRTASAAPPLSRTARRIRKSPTALGTRMPVADRRCAFPALGELLAMLERADDRRAAIGLDRDTCAGASGRSARPPRARRTPSTCRSGRCRRRSGRRSRRAVPSRAARRARSPSPSCPRADRAPSSVEQSNQRPAPRPCRPARRTRRSGRPRHRPVAP